MPERRDLDFIEDIVRAIEKIHRYIGGKDFREFKRDEKTVDAVIRNFEVIGEAAASLSKEFKKKHDEIDWRGVIDFRNVMIHGYFQVQPEVLWKTYRNNLPELEQYVTKICDS